MRIHRFYINEEIKGDELLIREDGLVHQWRDVFRYNVGSEVILFDGSGFEYDCVIEKINNREAELKVVARRKGIVPENSIILFQSLIKKDNMEWIVEKATELGVSKIVPLISERSEKKGFNLERARKIAIEASEQCGRGDVPEIGEITNLEECIMNYGKDAIIFDSSGTPPSPPLVQGREGAISIFIGPEGGWSPKELDLFKEKARPLTPERSDGGRGAKILSLGPLTLRAETAAISALTILGLQS